MTHIAHMPRKPAATSSVLRFFQAIGRAFVAFGEARSRQSEIVRLNGLSDAALAAKGIRRDQIVTYVFRDKFYL
ncbi:DUF1127 domain-containing protein [Thioclava litoralis]|uniref:DUF1127 domain-containing protein n=1 Tax=Thioclava litoralis TaxID=3076557 RepID=A0ABZ1E129_9RHOB|nr:DUF1127 domain-containing protein [Thioclava sp. FTW29]